MKSLLPLLPIIIVVVQICSALLLSREEKVCLLLDTTSPEWSKVGTHRIDFRAPTTSRFHWYAPTLNISKGKKMINSLASHATWYLGWGHTTNPLLNSFLIFARPSDHGNERDFAINGAVKCSDFNGKHSA